MKLIFGLEHVPRSLNGRAVTVGTFDGVHLGHQQILRQVIAEARGRGLRAAAVTFDPHPLAVLRPEAVPLQLTNLTEKAEVLTGLGLDELVVLPFTAELSAMAPLEFARRVLHEGLQARYVCEGWNFRFGQGGQGTPQLLMELGPSLGFTADVVEAVSLDGTVVSSTFVREQLALGNASGAWRALGRPYAISGPVVHGERRGRQLGFPTANIDVAPGRALPAPGVYAVGVRIGDDLPATKAANGVWQAGMANLGFRPTFGGEKLLLEVHILNEQRDLYGRTLKLAFLDRLREERKFAGPEQLIAQLAADRRAAEKAWTSHGAALLGPAPLADVAAGDA